MKTESTENIPTKEDIIPLTLNVPEEHKIQVRQLAEKMINHPAYGRRK